MRCSLSDPLDSSSERGHLNCCPCQQAVCALLTKYAPRVWVHVSLCGIHLRFQIVSFSGIPLIFATSKSSRIFAGTHSGDYIYERHPHLAPQVLLQSGFLGMPTRWISSPFLPRAVFRFIFQTVCFLLEHLISICFSSPVSSIESFP